MFISLLTIILGFVAVKYGLAWIIGGAGAFIAGLSTRNNGDEG